MPRDYILDNIFYISYIDKLDKKNPLSAFKKEATRFSRENLVTGNLNLCEMYYCTYIYVSHTA